MGVEDIMRERTAEVESDPRRLPTTPADDPTTPSVDETTPNDRAAEMLTETKQEPSSSASLPKPSEDPLGDRVDLKLELGQVGDIAAALSLAAKFLG